MATSDKQGKQAKRERQRREAAGRRAERVAKLFLILKGYRILNQRFQGRGGEIDLIAAKPLLGKPKLLAFVEVKQRSNAADLSEAIGPKQRMRIEAGANGFLATHPHLAGCTLRFDGVLIAPGQLPQHHKNMWQAAH